MIACPQKYFASMPANFEICAPFLHSSYNTCVENSSFPDSLKEADISPIFKKDDALVKKNYRPISVLPPMSKIFATKSKQHSYF